jgi:hypothetical protein
MQLTKCPQCKKELPLTSFRGLPLDQRCDDCIPEDVKWSLYDKRVQEAGQTVASILDASEHGMSLKPLERMVTLAYDAFGGPNVFMENVAQWMKDLSATPKGKGAALNAAMKILNLHAKVDRMKLEDDWKQMDDTTLRATLKIKLMALLSEAQTEQAKKIAKDQLLGGEEELED